jgi:hypothetical protein
VSGSSAKPSSRLFGREAHQHTSWTLTSENSSSTKFVNKAAFGYAEKLRVAERASAARSKASTQRRPLLFFLLQHSLL